MQVVHSSLFVATTALLSTASFAQFGTSHVLPGDAAVAPAVGDQRNVRIARGAGQSLMVWEDTRAGLTGTALPKVAWNGSVHLVVLDEPVAHAPESDRGVFATRVSPAGELLDATPILLEDQSYVDEFAPSVASDGTGRVRGRRRPGARVGRVQRSREHSARRDVADRLARGSSADDVVLHGEGRFTRLHAGDRLGRFAEFDAGDELHHHRVAGPEQQVRPLLLRVCRRTGGLVPRRHSVRETAVASHRRVELGRQSAAERLLGTVRPRLQRTDHELRRSCARRRSHRRRSVLGA